MTKMTFGFADPANPCRYLTRIGAYWHSHRLYCTMLCTIFEKLVDFSDGHLFKQFL